MSTKRCYYEVLGCVRTASADELRRAYKKEALKHHPDRNQGNPESEMRFKEVNEAYQVLTDDEKRRIYDQFGHAGLEGGGGGFDPGIGDMFAHMQDLFTEMFSGGGGSGFGSPRGARRGSDLRVQVRLSLRDAAFGCKREVAVNAPARCGDCSGNGAKKGTSPEVCGGCRGTGQVSNARGFVMFTATCQKCQGHGMIVKDPCPTCKGQGMVQKPRKVMVTFPAGIDAGQRLRVPGQGMAGSQGAGPGDLYVEVDVEEDARFERDGADLITRVHVAFTDAALGAEILVPCLGNRESDSERDAQANENATVPLTLPPGTQSNGVFTMKGQGIPRLDGRGRGALVVVVQVDVPTTLSDRARKLLEQL
ncbi:molecular chaperone DnaJ, partial [bacterium]